MSQIKLLLVTIVVSIIAIAGVATLFGSSAPAGTGNTLADPTILVKEDSPFIGPQDAKVVIVEFLDPECEACKATNPMVKQILADNEDKVKLVIRYFPLHGNSVLAARATEIAGEQGKYWEMQQKLFDNQGTWGEQQTPQTELFTKYAQELGLNVDTFAEVLKGDKYTDKVQRDKSDGQSLGVTGTPTFFVNGKKVSNISSLPTIVAEELKK